MEKDYFQNKFSKKMNKIFDCITFFQENFITNLRFEILSDYVDFFVICESRFDHRGKKKKLYFKLLNKKYKKKIIYLVLNKPFSKQNSPWKNQAIQRDFILKELHEASLDDYIMFSDPDEIPNPKIFNKFNLKKKFGIFLQKMYCYKFNLYNKHESLWEGTRICKKKNLFSIDYMRQKVVSKNLNKSFLKFYKEKSIEIFKNGGWHFNSVMSPSEISKKLKTFAHTEFSNKKYTNIINIKKNIQSYRDLFGRGIYYKKVNLDSSFPKYILENKKKLKKWIL
jgi:beta-1,4-mannosyl-glycoprotein beta-1,4-N-acetylglucosaminyltransferase